MFGSRIAEVPAKLIAWEHSRESCDAVLATSTAAVKALIRETRTVPIVFVRVPDPLGDGLVDSMAKPGGNVTGSAIWSLNSRKMASTAQGDRA